MFKPSTTTLLSLKGLPKIGNVKALTISKYLNKDFESSEEFFKSFNVISKQKIKLPEISKTSFDIAYDAANREIDKCQQMGVKIINYYDDQYPNEFRIINNPPTLLFSMGNLPLLKSKKKIAIIGARDSSDYAKDISYKVSEKLASNGVTIVSGLALGCDENAHRGSLEKGTTISILPSGLKNIYPKANQELANQILNKNGCLITEYTLESKPNKAFFIERNRLQSGISESIILIESKINGGSMKTIEFARKQGKKIYCWNHHFRFKDPEKTSGNLKLLNDRDIKSLSRKEDLEVFY